MVVYLRDEKGDGGSGEKDGGGKERDWERKNYHTGIFITGSPPKCPPWSRLGQAGQAPGSSRNSIWAAWWGDPRVQGADRPPAEADALLKVMPSQPAWG